MEIKCEYRTCYLYQSGYSYACYITSASIKEPNQEIKAFIGKHEAGKTDRDVAGIWFHYTRVHYMPRGISKIFPNLKSVVINNCGLKEITREDLVGLENIEELYLNRNKLTSLPDDLFEGMKKLKWINLGDNKLEFVSSQLLQPVLANQLTLVGFLNNPTISVTFDASKVNPCDDFVDLPGLMKLIDEKCKKPPKVENSIKPSTSNQLLEIFNANIMQSLKNMWATGQFSDFTIIVGDRIFSVHKCVLAMQSEYFAEIFKNAEEKPVTELKIEDLSSEAVEEVLHWIYTGTPDVKNVLEVFGLVMKLEISGLKEIAENLVLLKLNQENAMDIFELGHRYKSEKLKDLAFEEIKKFLGQQNLNENLKDEPEKLRKLVDAKKTFEEMLETLNRI